MKKLLFALLAISSLICVSCTDDNNNNYVKTSSAVTFAAAWHNTNILMHQIYLFEEEISQKIASGNVPDGIIIDNPSNPAHWEVLIEDLNISSIFSGTISVDISGSITSATAIKTIHCRQMRYMNQYLFGDITISGQTSSNPNNIEYDIASNGFGYSLNQYSADMLLNSNYNLTRHMTGTTPSSSDYITIGGSASGNSVYGNFTQTINTDLIYELGKSYFSVGDVSIDVSTLQESDITIQYVNNQMIITYNDESQTINF